MKHWRHQRLKFHVLLVSWWTLCVGDEIISNKDHFFFFFFKSTHRCFLTVYLVCVCYQDLWLKKLVVTQRPMNEKQHRLEPQQCQQVEGDLNVL